MVIKAVFFDLDGTLVDSNAQHALAWQAAFRANGWEFPLEAIHEQIGKGADNLVPALLPEADVGTQKNLGDASGDIFKTRFLDGVRAFPKARDLVARVHAAGQQVVLASSASQRELEHYLDLLDIRPFITATTSADDVKHTKPAPDIFANALGKVSSLTPDEVVVVGDTPYDVIAAARCGIAAIGLRSGKFPDDDLWRAGAVCLYDDAAALLADYGGSPLGQ